MIGGSLLLGLLFTAVGVWVAYESLGAVTWDAVQAEVVRTEVRRITSSQRRGSLRDLEFGYAPRVTYRWGIGGETFVGDRYRIGEGSSLPWHETREEAEEAASAYPAGAEITIYVDPDAPGSAVIDRSASPFILVPLALATPCLLGAAVGWRNRERIEEALRRGAGAAAVREA